MIVSCQLFSTEILQAEYVRLCLAFLLKRSGSVQVSISGNDAREVPADWLIAKKPRDLLRKFALGAINAVVRANKNLFAFAFALYLNGFSTND